MKLPHLLRFQRSDCEVHIALRARWLLPLLLGVAVWYGLSPVGVAAVSLVSIGLLVLFAYGWALALARGVHGQRKLRYGAFQVGDELEEIITLQNDSWLPVVWAEFVDHSSLPGHTVRSVRAVGGNSSQRWSARTVCRQRGVFTLGPWELLLGEPFGLFEVHQVFRDPVEVLVYPPLAVLPPGLLPRRGVRGEGRPDRQPLAAETTQAFAVRAYQVGDALKRVHWPTTARRDGLFVKVLEPEALSSIWLVPNFNAAVQLGQGEEGTLELLVILTASLAADLLRAKLRVGLAAAGAEGMVWLAPQTGQSQFWRILRLLAGIQAGELPLSEVLGRLHPLVRAQSTVLPITTALEQDWLGAAVTFGPGGCQALLMEVEAVAGRAAALQEVLSGQGIAATVVHREDVRVQLGAHGRLSRWEFRTLGTGRALLQHAPHVMGGLQ
ncbi:MAG: DUF58 domain-containing protein [Anaerolinea sp.]|nr:DUF58 domain-containing protein [Anaerolinea sp.]